MLKLCFWYFNDLILDFQACAWNVKIEGDTAVGQFFILRDTVECVKVRNFVAFTASRDRTLRSFDIKLVWKPVWYSSCTSTSPFHLHTELVNACGYLSVAHPRCARVM